MIYEYALDPKLVVDWAIASIGRCVGQFGMDQRRLVSDFPVDWKARVVGEFYAHFEYDNTSVEFQNAQIPFEAYVQHLTEYTVRRQIRLTAEEDWLTAAIVEDSRNQFHGIMTRTKPDGAPPTVITPDIIDQIRDRRWYLPTVSGARKSATEIAAALKPFLCMARTIVLVDPYFDADKPRFLASFAEIMRQVFCSPGRIAASPSITIFTGVQQAHKPRDGEFTPEQKRSVAHDLVTKACQGLPRHIPVGVALELFCLQNPEFGDPLHNRFVLTDVGGVIVPYGLDDYDTERPHQTTDDLQPMLQGIYQERWAQYGERRRIDVVQGPVRIEGAARVA